MGLTELFDELERVKAENAKLKEEMANFVELVTYYFKVRAKDPQCAGEVFRDLKDKLQALKGESDG